MLAHLSLECIGDDGTRALQRFARLTGESGTTAGMTPWVARIIGTDPKFKLKREFLQGDRSYAEANGVGSRGVMLHFWLKPGVYEVFERVGWSRSRRYFVWAAGGTTAEIDAEMVMAFAQHLDRRGAAEAWTPNQPKSH